MDKRLDAKVIYLSIGDAKKSATGKIQTTENYVSIELKPSKRRSKFDTILIPWTRVVKVIVY
jgi:hypothetical protein